MLSPTKHSNLKYSIINVSASIITTLKENSIIEYNDLLSTLKHKIGLEVSEVFLLSLNFLYILKRIEYIDELDSIRLLNEAV
ncbi:ABC-three component system middle component 6 [Sulfurimonas sp.]|uniref:ABC-three component system middle component 6 n=1 Tax=Sulfurimonas sp. TaxID=2022749 RepID=UPI003455E34D